jgi:hypothetical protein
MTVVCVWAAVEPVSSSVHPPQVARPLRWPRPPSPWCLVGLGGVVVDVGVAWVALGSDFSTTNRFIRVCKGLRLAGLIVWETNVSVKPTRAHIGVAGVVGTSSRLDAEYAAVRQDKGRRLTGPWKGGVIESASPWVGSTPKSDLYAGDAMDLYAKNLSAVIGAPHLIGRQVYGSPLYQGTSPGELVER